MKMASPILLFIFLSFISGCASIVSTARWPLAIATNPEGAEVCITNRHGEEVFSSKTPTAVRLKSGAGFFTKESYVVTLSMKGYGTKKIHVACKLNGWYFGNALIGGLIGFLIVDPATGAMYRLESTAITESLTRLTGNAVTLTILNKSDIPTSWQQRLERIH